MYLNGRQVWANSVDLDQTAPRAPRGVYSGSTLFATPSASSVTVAWQNYIYSYNKLFEFPNISDPYDTLSQDTTFCQIIIVQKKYSLADWNMFSRQWIKQRFSKTLLWNRTSYTAIKTYTHFRPCSSSLCIRIVVFPEHFNISSSTYQMKEK